MIRRHLIPMTMLVILAACAHQTVRKPASEGGALSDPEKSRHIVLTIGGLRSNEVSFGVFHELIAEHLEAIDPNYRVIPEMFLFDIHDFQFDSAKKLPPQINEKLRSIFEKNGGDPRPKDRISIVTYSMGGNIGATWLNSIINSPSSESSPNYLEHLDNFIALGAPFWGSKEAGVAQAAMTFTGRSLDDFLSFEWVQSRANTTAQQVDFVSPMSEGSFNTRQGIIEWKNSPKFPKYQFRVLSTVGLFPCASGTLKEGWLSSLVSWDFLGNMTKMYNIVNSLGKGVAWSTDCKAFTGGIDTQLNTIVTTIMSGGIRNDSDSVVLAPSANMNFIYAQDLDTNYVKGKKLNSDQFRAVTSEQKNITYHPRFSQIMHATLQPDTIDDYVIIGKDCKTFGPMCNHHYKYLIEDLAHCDRPNGTCDPAALDKFHQEAFTDVKETENVKEAFNSYQQDDAERAQQVRSFTLELNLRVPKDYTVPESVNTWQIFENIQFNFVDKTFPIDFPAAIKKNVSAFLSFLKTMDNQYPHFVTDGQVSLGANSSALPYVLQMGRSLEIYSRLVRQVPINDQAGKLKEKHLRIFLSGRLMPKPGITTEKYWSAIGDGINLPFRISLKGLKPRSITAKIKPALSTYVDLAMAPEKP